MITQPKIPITVDGSPLSFYNTPAQNTVFNQTEEQFIVLHKGRRMGCTRGAANCTSKAVMRGNVLWVDTIQKNLNIYWNEYFYPIFKKINPKFWNYKIQSQELRFIKNFIYFRSAEKPENIEGLGARVNTIVLNEAGRILKGAKGRSLWFNTILPMILDCHPQVYILGTPKGKRAKKGETLSEGQKAEFCLFFEMAQKGYNGNPNWKSLNYTSYDNPLYPRADVEELEAEQPKIVRRQEIYGEFIDVSRDQMFKSDWWQYTTEYPLEPSIKRCIMSIDTAFKIGEENDYSAFVVFLETVDGYIWIDTVNEKLTFPDLLNKTIDLYDFHKPDLVLIEDKGSGTSLVQTLKVNVPFPVKGVVPDKDKIERAQAVTLYFENGKVKILKGPWNKMATDQLEEFNASLDSDNDIVDAVSQLLNYAKLSSINIKPVIHPGKLRRKISVLDGY